MECPASINDLNLIDKIRRLYYPEDVLVPITLYELIIQRQKGNVIILKLDGIVIGYYAIIFFEQEVYNMIKEQKLNEKNLDNPKFIPLIKNETDINNKYVYVLSIAAADSKSSKLNVSLMYGLKQKLNFLQDNYQIMGVFADFFNRRLKKILSRLNIESSN